MVGPCEVGRVPRLLQVDVRGAPVDATPRRRRAMRVLRVHAPGTPTAVAEAVGRAAVEFNRGLDIRLRFLSIGIEETVVEVADAADAAERVAAALAERPSDAVVLFGEG